MKAKNIKKMNERSVIVQIFANLDLFSIVRARRVCKLWLSASNSEIVWYCLCRREKIRGEVDGNLEEKKEDSFKIHGFLLPFFFSLISFTLFQKKRSTTFPKS